MGPFSHGLTSGSIISQFDYTYDAAGQVTAEKSAVAEQPFTLPNTVITYIYANRLATVNGQPAAYDADGNMTAGPLAGAMGSFTYDARNRLTAAGNTGYIYDAENNRIGVTETVYGKTEQTSYVINPHAPLSQVLIKTDARGKQTFYVYGLGLIGQEEAGGAYSTYHFDRRGSTIALTDENGSVTERFQYAPYGELVNRSGTTSTPFQYNGRYGVITDANGLYYMRARYYNLEIKRFINQDVLLGSIDNGQSLNRYAYVNGNPVSYVDPFGLSRDGDSDNPSILQLIGQVWGNRINYAKNWLYGELEQRGFPYPDAALDAWDYSFGYFGGEVLGGAIGIGGKAFGSKGMGNAIETPYGPAIQSASQEAMQVKQAVDSGGAVFRAGQLGRTNIADGQFWATESPLNPGYANRYGVDFSKIDFITGGTVKPGVQFVTRAAPGLGSNAGGAMEVVTSPNSVSLDFFYMP